MAPNCDPGTRENPTLLLYCEDKNKDAWEQSFFIGWWEGYFFLTADDGVCQIDATHYQLLTEPQ